MPESEQMKPPTPLPAQFALQPFAVGHALDRGIGRGRLATPDLERPFYGVRSLPGHDRIAEYAPRLRPGDRFSHTTAAAAWGAPLPARRAAELHVTAGAGLDGPRARGVIGHESAHGVGVNRFGRPVSDPLTMYLEASRLLGLDEIVALGDYLVLDPRELDPKDLRPFTTVADLRRTAAGARGRGVRRAREAADLVRAHVESPMETALRLLLVRAGVPEPICGYELCDGHRRVGWFDLAWPQQRVIAEYDGDQHRTSTRQYDRDIQRFDEASALGWHVIRVRSRGIFVDPEGTVERVGRALSRADMSPNGRRNT